MTHSELTSKQSCIFTTSWDDGSVLDLRLGALLDRYGLRGTFYVPVEFRDQGSKFHTYDRRLNPEELEQLAQHHEIGCHSYSHTSLTDVPEANLRQEIIGSKEYLEQAAKTSIRMFCYPRGKTSPAADACIRASGYIGTRTTKKLCFTLPTDPFELGVSVQCAPFPFRKHNQSSFYWRRLLDPIKAYQSTLIHHPKLWLSTTSWGTFARAALHEAVSHGGYFHLYGHSWEIERCGMWNELESFLQVVKSYSVTPLTNGEVAELVRTRV